MASLCGDGEMWQKTRQPKAGLGQPKGQSEFWKEAGSGVFLLEGQRDRAGGVSGEMGEVRLNHTLGKLGEDKRSLDKGGRNLRGH